MTETRRERQRAATITEIKQIARRHMAEKGAAALSLRAIAREMGLSSPALYRYFASRDDLVKALIVDAFNSFADTLQAAHDRCLQDDHAARLSAVAHAYRSWALAAPQEYALIFGTPIPAYEAPPDLTGPVAARSMQVLLGVLDDTQRSGKANLSDIHATFSPALQRQIQPWTEKLHYSGDPALLYLAISGWALIHGLVSLEIFGHLDPNMVKVTSGALYKAEVATWVKRLKL
ncbi:MAG: TetR/AcrR family transcriptional regulator [Anaerolineaceae bacterium]|nr:MAG: TetR/AcrR family transcriptional regulator [Anaerolineaceae bacterium]